MQVDFLHVLKQFLAPYNVNITVLKKPYHSFHSEDYFALRSMINPEDGFLKTAMKFITHLPLNHMVIVQDYMDVFHVLFLMPDNLDAVIIGPFRIMNNRESHSKLKSLVDADVYHHLKEYLIMIPTIRENLMNVNITSMLALLYSKEKLKIQHIVEETPLHFVPNKRLFTKETEDVEERMKRLEERYYYENEALEAVTSGNVAKAMEMMRKMGGLDVAKRFALSRRSQKNSLIIFNSLLRKAIQKAGVHPYYIDEISSRYSQMIELVMDDNEYYMMMNMMMSDYCSYVQMYAANQYSSLIRKIVNYINMDLSKTHSLQEIANHVNMNPNYISAQFKQETGMTITYYTNHQKMKRAAELLRDTQLSITAVAEAVGFLDLNYFSRLFKKQMGRSPSAFRKK
ncbi:MAG: helix-turn-helix domain-containing protein [Erysipelotrichaceae bacterium]|nr:helix-turn-helix domain-containing protein [Erysipelotrichaceae bacterium]